MIDLLLILMIGVTFWPAVNGAFLFDDIAIERDPYRLRTLRQSRYQGWLGDLRLWKDDNGRCLTWWTFRRNFDWCQYSTRGYHLTNLAIHAANVILVRRLLEHWLSWERALLAAAIFAVHPLQTQSVGYISGRFGMLAAFFILASLELFFIGAGRLIPVALYLGWKSKQDVLAVPLLMGGLWLVTQ
jgi:hypothetical protein